MDNVLPLRKKDLSFEDEMAKGGNNRLSRKLRNVSLKNNSDDAKTKKIQNLLLENLDGIAEKLRRS